MKALNYRVHGNAVYFDGLALSRYASASQCKSLENFNMWKLSDGKQ